LPEVRASDAPKRITGVMTLSGHSSHSAEATDGPEHL
jgi:hypothetical protein